MASLSERLSTRKLRGPEKEPVTLTRSRIYILPTKYGYYFAMLLLVMLLGSINYNNSLGYSLTFLLASLSLVSILHTHRNIAYLLISSGTASPVFSGQFVHYPVFLTNKKGLDKYTIRIQTSEAEPAIADVTSNETTRVLLKIKTTHRGRHALGRVKIFTEYPLGLFHAWSWVELPASSIIYPVPESDAPIPKTEYTNTGDHSQTGTGQEDFSGLRLYRSGDSIKQVSWKHFAKTQELYTKMFTGGTDKTIWLDIQDISRLSIEQKLSRLSRWILDCHQEGFRYGLKIDGKLIEPDKTDSHMHKCLEELALYPAPARQS